MKVEYKKQLFFGLFQKLLKPLWGKGFLAKAIRRGFGKIKPLKQFYFYLFDKSKPESCIINGYQIFIHPSDKAITHDLLIKGAYEDNITELFKRYIKRGMTVLDIGANIGYFTLLASSLVGPRGKVYAFEPDPSNIELLRKSIKANNINNVLLVNKAVSDKSAKCKLYMPDKDNRGSFTLSPDGTNDYIEIEGISLDEYFNSNKQVDFIKMDIEGSEAIALEGMTNLIKNRATPKKLFMIMEFNKNLLANSGCNPHQFLDMISSCFEIYKVSDNAELEPVFQFKEMQEKKVDLLCIKK